MKRITSLLLIVVLLVSVTINAQNKEGRVELNLTGNGWRVWLDKDAHYDTDTLYAPSQVNLKKIALNPPTCGWDKLYSEAGIVSKIPASFEELFAKGDPLFLYHGVGWFSKSIDIPADWQGKTIELSIEKARLRVEVYINERLAGYDIVAETPTKFDVSQFLIAGKANHIAFRITNPGGHRGWGDFNTVNWGKKFLLPPGHDFGGIGGYVLLTAKPPCYINDLFVKNILPANGKRIELQLELNNKINASQTLKITAEIISKSNNQSIYTQSWPLTIDKKTSTTFIQQITVPNAKLWDVENPNLYYCKVYVNGDGFSDTLQERFGFRTFEAKANEKGEQNYYLNGKRIRLRSSIDWGYYAQTGFYTTDEMAKKSVLNAKAIGNNCLSFHRRIGEPFVMKYADELGLLIYEEPGGSPGVDKLESGSSLHGEKNYVAISSTVEKFKRMVVRDRNHPSVIIWNIANESTSFSNYHKLIFDEVIKLDNSRMLVNQSGGEMGGPSGYIPNLRPYSTIPVLNYKDDHTVGAESRFQEGILTENQSHNDSSIIHWGEVGCYTAPPNYALLEGIKDTVGYDAESWKPMAQKIKDYFKINDFSKNPLIKSPADFTVQAGRGLMYIDGRYSQAAMISNSNDGFAINGWSETNQSIDGFMSWYSAICDEGRNLKGPASDYAYWTRELQIAAMRTNGKYFKVGDTAKIDIHLINEGKLAEGKYVLETRVTDGNGKDVGLNNSKEIEALGGDNYAQVLVKKYPIPMNANFHAGYITLHCALIKEGKEVAIGTEQVLLSNRASYYSELNGKNGAVYHWQAAEKAIKDAGGNLVSFKNANQLSYIAVGEVTNESSFKEMLAKVKAGTTLVIRFDSLWADFLYQQKILKTKVTEWGGVQKRYWNGNGWGYLDRYIGNQAIPSKTCIGTNSWEVPSDPKGFYPFESNYPQQSHGAFFFRPKQLLTLLGSINYGEGKIILAPSYFVDDEQALNDLLFFKMITEK